MRCHLPLAKLSALIVASVISAFSFAADVDSVASEKAPEAASEKAVVDKANADKKSVAPAGKKMVQDATINLQTTVTGNQEQPRVLYILPWQSPQMGDVDFEMLDNQQKAVFGHVEREELRREMESAGEL